MKIAKELLTRAISTVAPDHTLFTNLVGDARHYASQGKSFKYFYFPEIKFTEVSKEEEKLLIQAFKSKIPNSYKEVSEPSELIEGTYYIEVQHPTRPLVEEDMSCISSTFKFHK